MVVIIYIRKGRRKFRGNKYCLVWEEKEQRICKLKKYFFVVLFRKLSCIVISGVVFWEGLFFINGFDIYMCSDLVINFFFEIVKLEKYK